MKKEIGIYSLTLAALLSLQVGALATHPACSPAVTGPITVIIGQPVNFAIAVDDLASDQYDLPVQLLLDAGTPLPSGASITPSLGTFYFPPAYGSYTFNWTPTAGQEGTYNLTFHAKDTDGNIDGGVLGFSPCTVQIIVQSPPTSAGTGTPGYWKNHSEAWCSPTITVGCVQYTVAQAIGVMQKPTKGDKTFNLFEQLVAAMLNVGCSHTDSSCVADAITAANQWLCAHPVGSGVSASSVAWSQISDAFKTLGLYNSGLLCAPHRD